MRKARLDRLNLRRKLRKPIGVRSITSFSLRLGGFGLLVIFLVKCSVSVISSDQTSSDTSVQSSSDMTSSISQPTPAPLSLTTFQAASAVVGQADFVTDIVTNPATTASLIGKFGAGIAVSASGVLFLSDHNSNRILGYNSVPSTNGASANLVLGQGGSFTTANSGTAANEFYHPAGLSIYNGALFVSEIGNSRVLIFNSVPTSSTASASIVLGQPGFGSSTTNCTQDGMTTPVGIVAAGGKLLVVDTGNDRVLIYNSIPTSSGAMADVVLGQPDFNTCGANTGGTPPSGGGSSGSGGSGGGGTNGSTASNLYSPTSVWTDGTRVAVVDNGNNRVLIWKTFPTTNGQAADLVMCQPDFTTNAVNSSGLSAKSCSLAHTSSAGVASDGTSLYVTDIYNHRILIWNTFPTSNFAAADKVIGQPDFISASSTSPPTSKTFNYPNGLYIDAVRLIVGDDNNARYMLFN